MPGGGRGVPGVVYLGGYWEGGIPVYGPWTVKHWGFWTPAAGMVTGVQKRGPAMPPAVTWHPPTLQGKLGLAGWELTEYGQNGLGAGPGPIGMSSSH